jgi:hypothetical protein
LGLRQRESSPAACPAHCADLLHSEPVGILGRQRTLRSRLVKSAQTKENGERILDNLNVALSSRADVLPARKANQILIEHQVDLARSHR